MLSAPSEEGKALVILSREDGEGSPSTERATEILRLARDDGERHVTCYSRAAVPGPEVAGPDSRPLRSMFARRVGAPSATRRWFSAAPQSSDAGSALH